MIVDDFVADGLVFVLAGEFRLDEAAKLSRALTGVACAVFAMIRVCGILEVDVSDLARAGVEGLAGVLGSKDAAATLRVGFFEVGVLSLTRLGVNETVSLRPVLLNVARALDLGGLVLSLGALDLDAMD